MCYTRTNLLDRDHCFGGPYGHENEDKVYFEIHISFAREILRYTRLFTFPQNAKQAKNRSSFVRHDCFC